MHDDIKETLTAKQSWLLKCPYVRKLITKINEEGHLELILFLHAIYHLT